ncbi:hypothetical protein BLA29_010929 [Euroglyphus maynei]|uniref:Uncharacterized protein n=1 Tax=Euroglyphus maynei TaxID=6958 RepID=A0A1Y3AMW0_EURMA|nr:hypothetical protein BLA29_010929 [Euroglyphus maynei]
MNGVRSLSSSSNNNSQQSFNNNGSVVVGTTTDIESTNGGMPDVIEIDSSPIQQQTSIINVILETLNNQPV